MPGPPALGARLGLAASFVRPGARLGDIGADHGYLVVHLAYYGLIAHGYACDIRPGPLQKSIDLITRFHLGGMVEARLGNGLAPLAPDEVDDIVIAGMGGETIAAILAGWLGTFDPDKRFILQPMTRPEALRDYLYRTGFVIEKEECAMAAGRPYSVMLAAYPGMAVGASYSPTLRQLYLGAIADTASEAGRAYLAKTARQLLNKAKGAAGTELGADYAQTAAELLAML